MFFFISTILTSKMIVPYTHPKHAIAAFNNQLLVIPTTISVQSEREFTSESGPDISDCSLMVGGRYVCLDIKDPIMKLKLCLTKDEPGTDWCKKEEPFNKQDRGMVSFSTKHEDSVLCMRHNLPFMYLTAVSCDTVDENQRFIIDLNAMGEQELEQNKEMRRKGGIKF